jgi:hypothetical protein
MGKSDQSIRRADELINGMICFDTFAGYCFLLVISKKKRPDGRKWSALRLLGSIKGMARKMK